MATTLISGGTVISAVGRREADVLIDGEKIVAILAPGQAASMGVVADRTIDGFEELPAALREIAAARAARELRALLLDERDPGA